MPYVCKREDAGVCAHKLSRRMSWVLGLGGGSKQFLSPYATRFNKARDPFRTLGMLRRVERAGGFENLKVGMKNLGTSNPRSRCWKGCGGHQSPASRPDDLTDAASRFGRWCVPWQRATALPPPSALEWGSARAPGPGKPGPRTCRESSRNAAWKSCLPGAGRRLRLPRPGPLGAGAGTLLSSRAAPGRILPGPAAGPRRGPLCTPGPRPQAPRAAACAARRGGTSGGSARGRGSAQAGARPRRER